MRLTDLSEFQLDALGEVGSIGAGHAATALSQLTGRPIGLTSPELELLPLGEVPRAVGGAEKLVGAVYCRLLGDLEGGVLFMAARDSSLAICDLMRNSPVGTTKSFGASEEAMVTHVASILTGAYLAAVARLANLSILPSPPSFALDMAGAILEVGTMEVAMNAESALLLRTSFTDEETSVDAALFFLPDPNSLEVILARLGVA